MSWSPSVNIARGGSYIPRKSYGHFEFLVCDWSFIKSEPMEKIVSQEFIMSDNSKWKLNIFPMGTSERHRGFTSIQIELFELGENEDMVTAKFDISVLDRKQEKNFSLKSPQATEFRLGGDENLRSWSIDNFLLTKKLEERFLQDDSVLFFLDIELLGKPEILVSIMPQIEGPLTSLSGDIGALLLGGFEEGTHSDITLVSNPKKFPCHRCILAARSEFFRKKFQSAAHNTKLVFTGGYYTVDNISPEVLEEVVHFIYTDECRSEALLRHSKVLFIAANRFNLTRLIHICEDYIGETLTPATVADALNLGLKSERLNKCCAEFIAANQQSVLASKTLNKIDPDILKDLIARTILPASSLLSFPSPAKVITKDIATPDIKGEKTEKAFDKGEMVEEDVRKEEKSTPSDFIPGGRGIVQSRD